MNAGAQESSRVEKGAPEDFRIVSVCPSNTEMLCALGLGRLLAGVDNYSDYPAAIVKDLPRVGPDLQIEIDSVVRLRPHLVVSSLSVPGMEKVVRGIDDAGLSQVVLSPHCLNEVFEDFRTLASRIPQKYLSVRQVESVIQSLQDRVYRVKKWVESSLAKSRRPRLYWEWWPKPVFSPGKRNWLTELSRLAGASNIFEEEDAETVSDDGAKVCAANPDWFLAVWTGVPQKTVPLSKILARDNLWQETNAYRNRHILILSEGLFCRPSPRLIEGLEQLAGILHPRAVAELGLKEPQEYSPIYSAGSVFNGGCQ